LPKFNPNLTGFASYSKRNELLATIEKAESGYKPELLLSPTKSLNFLNEPPKNTYLPTINKFEGYV